MASRVLKEVKISINTHAYARIKGSLDLDLDKSCLDLDLDLTCLDLDL